MGYFEWEIVCVDNINMYTVIGVYWEYVEGIPHQDITESIFIKTFSLSVLELTSIRTIWGCHRVIGYTGVLCVLC